MPSKTLSRPFSAFLMASQLLTTSSAPSTSTLGEDVGVAEDELVVDAPGHVGQGETALLGAEGGVEDDLEEQVAELLLERDVALVLVGAEQLDGVEDLVALLDQVAGERLVGLLPVPRALGPQAAHHLGEGHCSSAATGAASPGIQSEVRWSGSTTRSRSSQATSVTDSSGRPRRWRTVTVGPLLDRELDVGQDRWPGRTGRPAAGRWLPPRRRRSRGRRSAGRRRPRGRPRAGPRPGPGTTPRPGPTTSTRSSARSSSTVCSATVGEPGTA